MSYYNICPYEFIDRCWSRLERHSPEFNRVRLSKNACYYQFSKQEVVSAYNDILKKDSLDRFLARHPIESPKSISSIN